MFLLLFVFLFNNVIADDSGNKYGSEYILDGLNKGVKPCDDSYSFFCEKWLEKMNVSNDGDYLFERRRLTNVTDKILLEAIQAIDVNDKQTPTFKIWLKTYFDQCVNKKTEPAEIFLQIFNGVQRVIGPPPVLTKDKNAHDSLVNRNIWNVIGLAQRKLGNNVFFRVSVENTFSSCGEEKPVLTFSDQFYLESDNDLNPINLRDAILNMSVLFNVQVDDDDKLKKLIDNVISLNNDLKSFVNTSINDEDVAKFDTITVNSTAELTNINPNIDWQQFFKGLFSKDQFDYWDQNLGNIRVRNKKYFQQIDDVVKKYDVETVFNYIFYKAMFQQLVTTALTEVMSNDDRVADCVDWARTVQWAAAARTYFDYLKMDPTDINADITIIADNVLSTFKRIVANVSWLSTQEIGGIYKRVNSLNFGVPIPDFLSSDEKVEYVTIKYDPDKSMFDNSINLPKRLSVMELDRYVNQTPAIDMFTFLDPTVSSTWYPKLKMSFANFLLPLYSVNYPLAVKYGIVGTKIGQALMNEFSPSMWELENPSYIGWLNATKVNKITDQMSCVNDQISTLDCVDTPNCTARFPTYYWNYTLLRLMREIDGFQIAYQAFKSASQGKPESQVLPHLQDYNSDQLFALSAGRSYCNCYASDDDDEGGHTIKKNRLVKVFRNLPFFRSTFQCAGNAPSSVDKPCGIWIKFAG